MYMNFGGSGDQGCPEPASAGCGVQACSFHTLPTDPRTQTPPQHNSTGTFQSTGEMTHKETPWAIPGSIFAEDGSCS